VGDRQIDILFISCEDSAMSELAIDEITYASFDLAANRHYGSDFHELAARSPEDALRLLTHYVAYAAREAATGMDSNGKVLISKAMDGKEATVGFASHSLPEQALYIQPIDIVVSAVRKPSFRDRIMGRQQEPQAVRFIQIIPPSLAY